VADASGDATPFPNAGRDRRDVDRGISTASPSSGRDGLHDASCVMIRVECVIPAAIAASVPRQNLWRVWDRAWISSWNRVMRSPGGAGRGSRMRIRLIDARCPMTRASSGIASSVRHTPPRGLAEKLPGVG